MFKLSQRTVLTALTGLFVVAATSLAIYSIALVVEKGNELALKIENLESTVVELELSRKKAEEESAKLKNDIEERDIEISELNSKVKKKKEAAEKAKAKAKSEEKARKKAQEEAKAANSARAERDEAARVAKKEKAIAASEGSKLTTLASKTPNKPSPKGRTMIMEATAYTAGCKGCSGITATGIDVRSGNHKIIAVDPKVIPLGTRVHVEGYGEAIAGDTGGDIKGNRIDVLVKTKDIANNQWGRKNVKVTILD